MDIFSGALSSIGSGLWSQAILPGIPTVNMPAMASVTIPDEGRVDMPAMGSVQIPEPPPYTDLMGGGMWWGPFGPTPQFGCHIGQITRGVTGTYCGGGFASGFQAHVQTGPVQMPATAQNPFPNCGFPNPFFSAQLFGAGSSFYSAFANAFSGFRFG